MPSAATDGDLATAIFHHLTSKSVPPTQEWLQSLLPSLKPNIPFIANQRTAEWRILATDITQSVRSSPSSTFPAGIASPEVQELRVPGPVLVQVLDIEDVRRSRWSQVEAMEMEEKGEKRKGNEVIRVVPDEDEDNRRRNPTATQGVNQRDRDAQTGPHKLLLQDAKGNKAYAFELESVDDISVAMPIGIKLLLKDFTVARGVILLTAKGTELLGGKVEAWEKRWREERKKVLKERAGWREGMGFGGL